MTRSLVHFSVTAAGVVHALCLDSSANGTTRRNVVTCVECLRLLDAAPRSSAPPTNVAVPDSGPRCVVIIDDDHDTAVTLADLLEPDGHRVHVAFDGRSGLEVIRQVQPDVVFCDIGLPIVDGYDVARTLRNEKFRGRLVAFTGYASAQDRKRASDAGFDIFLAKPAGAEALIAVVSAAPRVTPGIVP